MWYETLFFMGWEKRAKAYASTAERVLDSKWTALALVFIVLIIAFGVRITPMHLPVTDNWAEQTIRNNIVSQAEAQVRQQFPHLPQAQVQQQALREYESFIEQNREQFQAQQEQLSQQFRSQLQFEVERPDGTVFYQTYLGEIDPYFYLKRVERVLETGSQCSSIVDGECRDDFMLAPRGSTFEPEWHTYAASGFAWIAVALGYVALTGVFFMPAILGALATVPVFFFVRRRFGSLAAASSAIFVGLHTSFLPRTMAGFSSTDAWNILFPVTIIWLVSLALEQQRRGLSWLYLVLAAVASAAYAQFWSAWWYTFFIMTLALLAVGVYKGASWIGVSNALLVAEAR